MSVSAQPSNSCIRRVPTTDARLAQAMRRLHELGPRLVCELEYEIEELQHQIDALRGAIQGGPTDSKGAELVGMLKGL